MKRPLRRKKAPSIKPSREESGKIVGMIARVGNAWLLQSANRRDRGDYVLRGTERFRLEAGQIGVAEKLFSRRGRMKEAKLTETLGDFNSPKAVSLIALATHGIPDEYSKEAMAEASAAKPIALGKRADLRAIPLVTVDGKDARDFDDAIFAEKDGNGWHLIVAIADVAHYVRPGSPLDKEAFRRGNSTYFPDRVVPMLPEALSNELCSLKPNVDRACIAAHLWIDRLGELTKWRFVRGIMKSRARLTYEQLQAAKDGKPDAETERLMETVVEPLYGAFHCLMAARGKRGTLELDLPERVVELDNGKIKAIKIRDRLDSHRLIEEYMITANVAAAAQLEGGGPALYRIHDKPMEMKLEGLRDFLDTLGIGLVPNHSIHSRFLTRILENAAGTSHAHVVNEMILRSQSQAVYSRENIGHFGLALAKYAHFTSPIRRYADLIVHRGLIRACSLGDDGLTEREIEKLDEIAEHISATERQSAAAERDSSDRFITLFMADRVGSIFPAKISGVARFGLFARLDETGADGIIPIDTLPRDYYYLEEKSQALIGRRTKRTYRLGQVVEVRLDKADKLTGSMVLEIVEKSAPHALKTQRKKKRPKRASGTRNEA